MNRDGSAAPIAARALAAAIFVVSASGLRAQAPSRYPVLPEEREIALARSAAPAHVGDSATIYVWRPGGHVKRVDGTNGFACIVTRDHPESLYPICYDAEAARTILPIELHEMRLRASGRSEAEVRADVEAGFASGRFSGPSRPAMTWMMSREQVLYAGAEGPRVGPWYPHIMLYFPGLKPGDLGIASRSPDRMQIAEAGTPRSHLVVPVRDWSRPDPKP